MKSFPNSDKIWFENRKIQTITGNDVQNINFDDFELATGDEMKGRSLWVDASVRYAKNKMATICLFTLILICIFSIFGNYFAAYSIEEIDWAVLGMTYEKVTLVWKQGITSAQMKWAVTFMPAWCKAAEFRLPLDLSAPSLAPLLEQFMVRYQGISEAA